MKELMKAYWQQITRTLILATIILSAAANAEAQTNQFQHPPAEYGVIQMFAQNPAAMYVITNLLNEPPPALTVPAVSQTANGTSGTYWTLKGESVPLPFDPYPDLPVYQISTNREFVIDDRSVDYAALNALAALEDTASDATNSSVFTGCQTCAWDDGGLLWIEVTNNLDTPGQFNAVLHNTVQGQGYDILTTPNLLGSWAAELVVTGAVGNLTPVQIPMNNSTAKFLRVRTSVAYSFYLVTLPLSQTAQVNDMVTFYVETGGNTNLSFQWTFNGSAIDGATNSSYTVNRVQSTDGGDYACIISDGTNSLVTAAGTLAIAIHGGDLNRMKIYSSRQNYTFKSGVTYYIPSQFLFYGKTTIEAGAVIKPDWMYGAGLVILGTLDCKGEPYLPAVITSVDDDSIGENLGFSDWDGWPQPYQSGVPYLELACCKNNSIHNLRIAYADYGVTTPTASQRLDLWDCQFLQCNYGVVNLVPGSSTNTLHNVLFSACGAAVGAATNAITIEAEQVTADVGDFCLANAAPNRMALTNSIILGNPPSATSMVSVQVALNPDGTNFTPSGTGITSTNTAMYYLAANSPLHQTGSATISPRLQAELRNKTTYAPVALPPWMNLSGNMTLLPQAPRYTNGAPDIGYYYDALDYTMADLRLTGGTLNVLPGTAVGFRMDFVWAATNWTYIGMDVCENAHLNVQGMPNKPCVFVDVQQVQEQFAWPVRGNFVPDYWPQNDGDQPPVLNFRFANLYADYASYYQTPQYHFWSGISWNGYEWSADSAMFFTLQDCQLRGGQLDIGTPDNPDTGYGFLDYTNVLGSGAVTWNNNLFDGVSVNLDPTYYSTYQVVNCDLRVTARNNLFRNTLWFNIYGTPATAGNWTFQDNLFDKVQFYQDPTSPLDFDHNGYWPLLSEEIIWAASGYVNQLQPTATSDGGTEVILSNAPPYQAGAYGNYYLSQTNALYQAGSRTASDAGLTQYTTLSNQTRDEADAPVNIGLHYVAATNSLPLDSDGDGVPDYVEVEHGTDPNNPMTDGMTPDAYSDAYDNVDLSGNGMVGRIKDALGLDPTNTANPLILIQVITGDEPDTVTFKLPINYVTLTNIGLIHLKLNGVTAEFDTVSAAPDGNTLLSWAAIYDVPAQYLVQAQMQINITGNELTTLTCAGVPMPFINDNNLQFFFSDSFFDDKGAYLDAQLPEQSASYTIQLYDPSTTPETFIKGITNSTSSGMIQEDWNLTYDDGVTTFSGSSVDAVYDVKLASQAANPAVPHKKQSRIMPRLNITEQGNGFDFTYMYTPTTGTLYHEFDYDFNSDDGVVWVGMQSIVDDLIMPQTVGNGGNANHYDSGFNFYTSSGNNNHGNGLSEGFPGFLDSMYTITNGANGLFLDMSNGITRNFYCYAHGCNGGLACYAPEKQKPSVSIYASQIRNLLRNDVAWEGHGYVAKFNNPYRFVFLDGCSTASGSDWRMAFGMHTYYYTNTAARGKVGPQAYVGWGADHTGLLNSTDDSTASQDILVAYTITLFEFYDEWMQGNKTVAECIHDASMQIPNDNSIAFPVPGNETIAFSGTSINGSGYSYIYTNVITSPIYVIGHSGLTRGSWNPIYDNIKPYAAPRAIQ